MTAPTPPQRLLAVPNFSEGRDEDTIAALERALAPAPGRDATLRLLDVHSDADHHRSVFTLAGAPGALAGAVLAGAAVACERIDVVARSAAAGSQGGRHPHVGATDVAPIVYLDESARGAACAEALVLADRIGSELGVPVFLYGELTRGEHGRERSRAELRRGGVAGLGERMVTGVRPDFGPGRLHPRAGATLVAARPPLVAFNVELAAPATLEDARAIAAQVREGGEHGLPGLRAIAVPLSGGEAQVSMNVEQPLRVPLAGIVREIAALAPVARAELVGLAPAAALAGFPADVPMPAFDPARHIIENALGC
jgi:glutamate formiminotransferase/glutamate formiminotransferase/formiminotetrahydrofolate cyclodeaminase